ncbi:carbohydrate ABC transporter permease [Arenibacterium sp. LLYu02]|uniref:carbohydrate ABC transporter permease n=1 Tax=Arenibacterium sp. LLYu02 TaxID=3404132 RepID=UPI003B223B7D
MTLTTDLSVQPAGALRFGWRRDTVIRWLLPAPAVLFLLMFTVVPLVDTLWLSFHHVRLGREPAWTGLANYARIFSDHSFWIALRNTALFTGLAVAFELILGLALALLLFGEVTKWRSVLRTAFLLPMVMSPVVVGITWRALLTPGFGWISQMTGGSIGFLSDPDFALFTLVLVDVWQWTPFMFVLLLSGLLSIPAEILEAARIDGANGWQRLRRIILPSLAPLISVVVLLRSIDAFKIFDLVFNLTQGGPGISTETLAFYIYRLSFKAYDLGYGAAISVALSVLISVLISLFLRLGRAPKEVG